MIKFGHFLLAAFELLALTGPLLAQNVSGPFGLSRSAPGAANPPVAAREPWSVAERSEVMTSAMTAAAALPDRLRASMQLRLAVELKAVGDQTRMAEVLRQAVTHLYRPGAPLRALAENLVEADAVDSARKLVADAGNDFEKQQILSGMLDGALRVGRLNLGVEVLRVAERLPRAGSFDPYVGQAKTLADALAKGGDYKQALAVYPVTNLSFAPSGLPTLATKACASDPSLVKDAAHLLAVAALERANARFGTPPIDEVQAFEACEGPDAAKRLIDAMPLDTAELVSSRRGEAQISDTPYQLASAASAANRAGDAAKADHLFAEATARLAAELPSRALSPDRRRAFDTAAGQVSVFLLQADRAGSALAVSVRLLALERLPLLFELAKVAIRLHTDPEPFLAAIDQAFSTQPALIEVETGEIRALRGSLPLGSPIYQRIGPWFHKLPAEPMAMNSPSMGTLPPKTPVSGLLPLLLTAAEKAAPALTTVRRVLDEARRGDVVHASSDAKGLTLTASEIGFVAVSRAFIAALPPELLAPMSIYTGGDDLFVPRNLEASAADSLLVAVERVALDAHNIDGARSAFADIDEMSPIKGYATTTLAIGEARDGLPREALSHVPQIEDPTQRFAALSAIVAVKPTN